MSKVLFIYPAIDNESLAIEYLSSVLKQKGHETDLILNYLPEKDFKGRLMERIDLFKPDFIGFSVVTDDYSWACDIAKFIKEKTNLPIIFGGIQVTSCPEIVIANSFVDYAVLGEGEQAICDIVENPERTDIANVWNRKGEIIFKNPLRELIQDLDSISFPDKTLFFKEAPYLKDIYHCITSRGCPFFCSYCYNHQMRKLYDGHKWLRKRSVQNVIEELKIMKKDIGYKQILFVDDCFISDVSWLEEFAKLYKEKINVPFRVIAHPQFINKDIARLLKQAGCIRVQLGVQTPIQRIRKHICNRFEDNETILNAVSTLKKEGIFVQIDHIFGLPSEKINEYEDCGIEFYISLKPNIISSFWLQYYPNTEIIEIGKKHGEIDDKTIEEIKHGKINYDETMKRRQSNPELMAIYGFFCWIPILPKFISRIILKKRYYKWMFKNPSMNKIPYAISNMSSMKNVQIAMKRKKDMKEFYRSII